MTVATGLAGCGGTTVAPRAATPRPVTTPTADPAVADVTAVAKAFVEAVAATAKSGDPKGANNFIVPGAPALGNVGSTAEYGMETGHNFVALRVDFRSDLARIADDTDAIADLEYSAFGHEATLPGLQPREADHETTPVHLHIELQKVGGKWLVYAFS